MLKVILSMSLKLASVCFFCSSLNFVPNGTFLNEVRHSPSCPTETSEPSDLDHGGEWSPCPGSGVTEVSETDLQRLGLRLDQVGL